jgi:hypothetical protein
MPVQALICVVVAVSGLLLAGCVTKPAVTATLDGTWRSEAPEVLPGQAGATYLIREFEFSGSTWRIHFTVYADQTLTVPLFSGENAGDYVIAGEQLTAAQPAEFRFRERTLQPLTQNMADALTRAGCGNGVWTSGKSQSVFERGCLAFRVFPHSECDREYDQVQLTAGRLFLGARPSDGFMCRAERRPQTVSADALQRVRGKADASGLQRSRATENSDVSSHQ